MTEDIRHIITETAKETADEVERRTGVLIEGLQADIHQIAEAVDTHPKQLDSLQRVPQQLDDINERLGAIETTLESVNLPILKQKIGSLEKRVADLEARQRS